MNYKKPVLKLWEFAYMSPKGLLVESWEWGGFADNNIQLTKTVKQGHNILLRLSKYKDGWHGIYEPKT
jgi:hypothetical protein